MTYSILSKTEYGWTDNIGDVVNQFETEEEALRVCVELRNVWGNPFARLRVVPTSDLPSELLA